MNFFFQYVAVYNGDVPTLQYFPVSPQALLQNSYQSSNILYQSSQAKEQNTLIITSNVPTHDSLNNEATPRTVLKKKKPAVKKQKDQNFGWRIQNKDRNIMSNILKAFVAHMYEEVGMRPYLQALIPKLGLSTDLGQFEAFFKDHFRNNSSYISSKQVKTLLRSAQGPEGAMLMLKLALNKFFRVDFPLVLLKSTKIKRRSKLEQMKKSRELLEILFRE